MMIALMEVQEQTVPQDYLVPPAKSACLSLPMQSALDHERRYILVSDGYGIHMMQGGGS